MIDFHQINLLFPANGELWQNGNKFNGKKFQKLCLDQKLFQEKFNQLISSKAIWEIATS
jgi:hypothetical protein